MKKQIMLGGLLLLLGSCTPQNKANDPNAIDIAVSLEHLTELKTSQLGKQIRYIPLETTDSSLIGNSYSIKLSKDHIFVSTNGRCLSLSAWSLLRCNGAWHLGIRATARESLIL